MVRLVGTHDHLLQIHGCLHKHYTARFPMETTVERLNSQTFESLSERCMTQFIITWNKFVRVNRSGDNSVGWSGTGGESV